MASVPGIQVLAGRHRLEVPSTPGTRCGQNNYYTGYEYDGVPVNRAFDNYNGSTEPSLGVQELQIYPGGGPSSVASNGTAGFINQVIKTGTFPGFASESLRPRNAGISPTKRRLRSAVRYPIEPSATTSACWATTRPIALLTIVTAAATRCRAASFRATSMGPASGSASGSNQVLNVGYTCLSGTCQGVKPLCPLYGAKFRFPDQGCWQFYGNVGGNALMVSDRESVINAHLGIPKAKGLRDDVQLLWSGSALNNYGYNSPSDLGPGVNQFIYSLYNTKYAPPVCGNEPIATWGMYSTPIVVLWANGCTSPGGSAKQIYSMLQPHQLFLNGYYGSGPYRCPTYGVACAPTYIGYSDAVTYNLPFGTPIATSPTGFKRPSIYFAPNAPPPSVRRLVRSRFTTTR